MNSINETNRFTISEQHAWLPAVGSQSWWLAAVAFTVVMFAGVAAPTVAMPSGNWAFTGEMVQAQVRHSLVKLDDGRALVAGGLQPYDWNTGTPGYAMDTAQIYDPTTGQWSLTGSLNAGRYDTTLTRLSDGRVLVAGGRVTSLDPTPSLASAEIYDPATGQWTVTGSMNTPRHLHTASLLPDGRVLVTGGRYIANSQGTIIDTATTEIYDPNIGQWTSAGDMSTPRERHSGTLLPDGRVLIAGGSWDAGFNAGIPIDSAEIYNPATGQWSLTGSMNYSRILHGAALLQNGTVLVAGGASGGRFDLEPSFTAEIYDPALGVWTQTGNTQCAHGSSGGFNLTALFDGTVLLPGVDSRTDCDFKSAEIFTPGSSGGGNWALTGAMKMSAIESKAVLLDDGTVLLTRRDSITQVYTP